MDIHGTQSKALHVGSRRTTGKREATLWEEQRLAFPLSLFPHMGGRTIVLHGQGKQHR
jgi:hypothetical protein